MKKVTAMILTLALVCILPLALAEQTGAVGTWYMTEVTDGKLSMSPSLVGIEMTFVLNEDGSAELSMQQAGQTMETTGTWEQTENKVTIFANGQPEEMTLEGDKMTVEMGGGMTGVLTQTPPEAFVIPTVVAAETAEAFYGTWQVENMVGEDGTVLPAALLGLNHILTMEEGKVTETDPNAEEGSSPTEYTTEFVDGTLVITTKNPYYPASGEEYTVLTVQLTDNGQLTYDAQFGAQMLTYYLKPVVEE